ncbi:hypothetical protein HUJ04_011391 [Dendroctonus ponderosae]|nr:hypothetical protein HUJ04_011391 [Dendroctonus ponderosae]
MLHGSFGGGEPSQKHYGCDVKLSYGNYSCTFEALDKPVICSSVASVLRGPWAEELRRLNIQISDSVTSSPIEVLIGSDIAGKLYTSRRHILQCGLVAVESMLGWTLMGKIPLENPQRLSMTSISLLTNHVSIANLWELDVLGIKDPAEKRTWEETAIAAKELFPRTVKVDLDGRYEEITEACPRKKAYYLPHRPVIKPNSVTTKIRPVFDPSAKEKDLKTFIEESSILMEQCRFDLRGWEYPNQVRAVHLELCNSLSTSDFIQALRRFIARRGRPKTVYSDNGTNFVGTNNAFARLDFGKIAEIFGVERIQWRFNPQTATWWGGFWEDLVGVLKQLLRKVLGRASLDYESLATLTS